MKAVRGIGIGLRNAYADALLSAPEGAVDWLEIVPENWLFYGGNRRRTFDACRERWAMISHSVSLNVGGTAPFDEPLLAAINELNAQVDAPFWSDHICFSSVENRPVHDLIPLPMNEEVVAHLVQRTAQLRDLVPTPLVLENATFYVTMPGSTMGEAEFLTRVYEACDIGMLLDVNNVYVNALNHGFDARAFIDALPLHRVQQIHVAGHTPVGDTVIDTHIGPTPDPVWQLYEYTLQKLGRVPPTLIEWDQDIPALSVMLDEVAKARAIAERVVPR